MSSLQRRMVEPKKLVIAGVSTLALLMAYRTMRSSQRNKKKEQNNAVQYEADQAGKRKGQLNRKFLHEILQLIKIVLPTLWCKEALLLAFHTIALALRTFLSIQVASLDGKIVKAIVDRKKSEFVWRITQWLLIAIPATYTNSMIRFLESKLAIAFRTKMTLTLYQLYMTRDTYYRVENLDSRLTNADQCLTEDVSRFCSTLAHLHSQVSKPLLDVVLMSAKLISLNMAIQENTRNKVSTVLVPTLLAGLTIWLTARALKLISPPFGKLVAEQAQLEGEFRYAHSRLITNAEEIAFYGGHAIEKTYLERAYLKLIKHMNKIFKLRIFYNMAEGFLMKYFWSAAGMTMVAIPGFTNTKSSVSARTQDFIIARGLLISAADAIERIMSSYKELTELSGYTSRVSEMIHVFRQVHDGHYEKTRINQTAPSTDLSLQERPQLDLQLHRGEVTEGDLISFDDVPIVSPNGDVLVQSLSFVTRPGMHVLISGPNGCGKSSLFRILGGLWPTYGGRLTKPEKGKLFYIPQRPYLSVGCLRDQIIYPDTLEQFACKRTTPNDDDLEKLMKWVHLEHIVKREGGWDAVNNWQDVLSGGEKQRVGMARLFYHRPSFAILDECTSAVSIDVEGAMYNKAKELGISLLTVTHRPSLWKYHDYLLQFDGEGGWKFDRLTDAMAITLREEKAQLETQLAAVDGLRERLTTVCKLLDGTTPPATPLGNSHDDDDDCHDDNDDAAAAAQ